MVHKVEIESLDGENLLQIFQGLINKTTSIKELVGLSNESGDARIVGLHGLNSQFGGAYMTICALRCVKETQGSFDLSVIENSRDVTDKSYSDFVRLGLLDMVYFKLDSLIYNLLRALNASLGGTFHERTERLLKETWVDDAEYKARAFAVLNLIRNSLHNNGMVRSGRDTVMDIRGTHFEIKRGNPQVRGAGFIEQTVLYDFILDVLKEVIMSEKVRALDFVVDDFANQVTSD